MHKTTADQHPCGALCVSRILPKQKNWSLRCSAYLLNTAEAKTRQVALWEIPPSAEIRTPLEQLSPEHPSSSEQYNSAGASFCRAVCRSHLLQKWRSGEELLQSTVFSFAHFISHRAKLNTAGANRSAGILLKEKIQA
jgi:hypothetical protein